MLKLGVVEASRHAEVESAGVRVIEPTAPALEAGKVDMVISGMTITPARNRKVAFVGPYYVSGKGILALEKRYAELQDANGLNAPEVTQSRFVICSKAWPGAA